LAYGCREAVPCTKAAYHAYLSFSAVGADSLLHTFLRGECGIFGLATCVPSLHLILQSPSRNVLLIRTASLFCFFSLLTVPCSSALAQSRASIWVSQSALLVLPDVASGFDFLASLSSGYDFLVSLASDFDFLASLASDFDFLSSVASDFDFLASLASGFDFLASLSVMINFFNKSATTETCCLHSQSSDQLTTSFSAYSLAVRCCSC